MDTVVGVLGLTLVFGAIVWGVILGNRIKRARANIHVRRQETPAQKIAWRVIAIIALALVACFTILGPVLGDDTGNYSSLNTLITGRLQDSCCEPGPVYATALQRILALVQSVGVAAVTGLMTWWLVRQGNTIYSEAIAAVLEPEPRDSED
ncbi:hypothetical protein [Timonella sp. A28]|uniref:hypothetical protein n=1 Tax=Timonella sp. A28 TaxID=3442640 RepID=UPI003EC0D9A6